MHALAAPAPAPATGRARRAVTVVFAVNGVVLGASVARIPAVRDQVGAGTAALGLALVGVGVGSLLTLPWSGHLVRRLGSTRVVVLGAVVSSLGWGGAGLATSVPALLACLVLAGAGFGLWDVAMNVAGHVVEQDEGRSRMPMFHAAFSAGALAGAAAAAAAAALGAGPRVQFPLVAALAAAVVAAQAGRFLGGARQAVATTSGSRSRSLWLCGPVLVLGVLVVGTAFGEGAANDWLALALVDERRASETVAALAYGAFHAMMVVGRLAGGVGIDRWGRVAVLRAAASIACVGVLLFCLVPALPVALVGTLLWGLGLSVVFPAAMSAAGEAVPGRGEEAIAVVSTIGYAGFLAGPPLLGLVAEGIQLDRALLLVAAFAALVVAIAGTARPPAQEQPG